MLCRWSQLTKKYYATHFLSKHFCFQCGVRQCGHLLHGSFEQPVHVQGGFCLRFSF